jgi:hypothetical protein
MAAHKFLKNNSGVITEEAAVDSSSGAGDAGKIPALDSAGKLNANMMPTGVDIEVSTITASEDLSGGDFVNVWESTGAKARKADATTAGKEATGFVLAAVTSGNPATVYLPGQENTGLTGLTPGAMYWLNTTVGGVTTTAPSSSGNAVQKIGRASSASSIIFNPSDPYILV